jgi:murein endopeptidase
MKNSVLIFLLFFLITKSAVSKERTILWAQMPDGEGYTVLKPAEAYGQIWVLQVIQDVIKDYIEAVKPVFSILIGDISIRKPGKRFGEHKTHRWGEDIDIAYISKKEKHCFERVKIKDLDIKKQWRFLEVLILSNKVKIIFMDEKIQKALYKEAVARGWPEEVLTFVFQFRKMKPKALIQHWPGHFDHMHIRLSQNPRYTFAAEPSGTISLNFAIPDLNKGLLTWVK